MMGRNRLFALISLIFILVVLPGLGVADESTEDSSGKSAIPQFNRLRTPDSPAFVILGVSPTEVQRPNSVKALSASFGNSFTKGSKIIIPENIALEFSPYWLFSHEDLNYKEYVDAGFFKKMLQNLTFSVGATNEQVKDESTGEEITVSLLGVGIRSTIIESRRYEGFDGDYTDALAEWGNIVRNKKMEILIDGRDKGLSEDQIKEKLDKIDEQIEKGVFVGELTNGEMKKLEQLETTMQDKMLSRMGFALDAAAALALSCPDAKFDDCEASTVAGWLTGAYLTEKWSLLALARYRVNGLKSNDAEHLLDAGLRVIYGHDWLALSVEGVYRRFLDTDTEEKDFFRVDLGFDVALGKNTWINVTFGKGFSGDDVGSLIALANLKWGLGDRPMTLEDN